MSPRYPATTTFEIGSGGQLYCTGSGTTDDFYAVVNLPNGAAINRIRTTIWDGVPGVDLTVELYRLSRATASYDPIFSTVSTVATSTGNEYTDDTNLNAGSRLVDNLKYSYVVRVAVDGSNWTFVRQPDQVPGRRHRVHRLDLRRRERRSQAVRRRATAGEARPE